MSVIKGSTDGIMILTLHAMKNSIFRAAGSEFTCRYGGGKSTLLGLDQLVLWLSSRPAFATFLVGSPFPSLSLLCSWVRVKLGVVYDCAKY